MEFQKYPSITNSYSERFLDKIHSCKYTHETKWYVTEKIHGANFSYWSDGQEVKVASRSQFVDTNFMKASSAIEKYIDSAKYLSKSLMNEYGNVEHVVIFGELYGNGIQKGIQYGEKDFIVFDVAIKRNSEDELTFLTLPSIEYFAEESGFEIVDPLYIGTLENCLKYPNDFDSKILDIKDNICEGVVIKPIQNITFSSGTRVILKNKNDKWSEKQRVKTNNKPKNFTHELQPQILEYITENRFNNLMSKLGGIESLTSKDFGKVLGMYSSDVIEELIADGLLIESWKKDEKLKPLGSWVTNQSKALLIELFLKKV